MWDAAYGLFQLATEPCRATLSGHNGAVTCLLAHSDGVLSCSADATVRIWRAGGSHECVREVRLPCGPVYQMVSMGRCVARGHARAHMACACASSAWCRWATEFEWRRVRRRSGHQGEFVSHGAPSVFTVCFVCIHRYVWAAGHDGALHALDGTSLAPAEASGTQPAALRRAHAGFVSGLCALQVWHHSHPHCGWSAPQISSCPAAWPTAHLAAYHVDSYMWMCPLPEGMAD